MKQKKIQARIGILILIVFAVAFSRLLPYLFGIEEIFNFSPLTAIALFGGAYFVKKKNALIFPLIALWASNLILDNIFLSQYYEGFVLFANWEVYIAILGIVALAFVLLQKVTLTTVIGTSILASLTFFIVTNFIVWLNSGIYPRTFAGLGECFTLAIPFFRNTLVGDLVFSMLLFGAYEYAATKFPFLKLKTT
ncbi:MAG: DUF6580 family putative transport protein [Bacteroidota bacterium]